MVRICMGCSALEHLRVLEAVTTIMPLTNHGECPWREACVFRTRHCRHFLSSRREFRDDFALTPRAATAFSVAGEIVINPNSCPSNSAQSREQLLQATSLTRLPIAATERQLLGVVLVAELRAFIAARGRQETTLPGRRLGLVTDRIDHRENQSDPSWSKYGITASSLGWEIDHIVPVSKGGRRHPEQPTTAAVAEQSQQSGQLPQLVQCGLTSTIIQGARSLHIDRFPGKSRRKRFARNLTTAKIEESSNRPLANLTP